MEKLTGGALDSVGAALAIERAAGEDDASYYARIQGALQRQQGTRQDIELAVELCLEHKDFFVLEGGPSGFPGQVLVLVCRHLDGPGYDGLVETLRARLPAWVTFKVQVVDDPEQAAALRTVFRLGGVDAARKLIVE